MSAFAWAADPAPLRIGIIEQAPPMSYRDAQGELTGFSLAIMQALCDEMRVPCVLQTTRLDRLVDEVAEGRFDIGAVGLLETPERRSKVLFARPYYRSVSLWLARAGVEPGQPNIRAAVVRASVQERFAQSRGWRLAPVATDVALLVELTEGHAQGALVTMATGLYMLQQPDWQKLNLVPKVMNDPELSGDAAFIVSPRRADIKARMDAALEQIKRNGVYDRLNSRFLPFRVN